MKPERRSSFQSSVSSTDSFASFSDLDHDDYLDDFEDAWDDDYVDDSKDDDGLKEEEEDNDNDSDCLRHKEEDDRHDERLSVPLETTTATS